MHREPKTIALRPCTPPSTLEMRAYDDDDDDDDDEDDTEIAYERILAWQTGGR